MVLNKHSFLCVWSDKASLYIWTEWVKKPREYLGAKISEGSNSDGTSEPRLEKGQEAKLEQSEQRRALKEVTQDPRCLEVKGRALEFIWNDLGSLKESTQNNDIVDHLVQKKDYRVKWKQEMQKIGSIAIIHGRDERTQGQDDSNKG